MAGERTIESVRDYPRPPRLEDVAERIRVVFCNRTIADSVRAVRVLETTHPPTYYIPPSDIDFTFLSPSQRQSLCEFKGVASYWNLDVGDRVSLDCGWCYKQPTTSYERLTDHLAFYASRVDSCRVGEETVIPQQGDFYGGWITSWIRGPFKGAAGTRGW